MRPKIAVMIRNFVVTGGAERYAVEITRRMTEDFDTHVFCYTYDASLTQNLTVHQLTRWVRKPSFINQWLFAWQCDKFTRQGFDFIHSHERTFRFNLMTLHCPCYKSFYSSQKHTLKKILLLARIFSSPRHLGYFLLERLQFSPPPRSHYMVVSHHLKSNVLQNYPHLTDNLFTLAYPGVDLDTFKPVDEIGRQRLREKYDIPPHQKVILFVGTEFKRKGLLSAILMLPALKADDSHLYVAGNGDSTAYMRIAQQLGVSHRVHFLGLVKNIQNLYPVADIFTLPSSSDPSPMSPLESLACGVPVVVSSKKWIGFSEHLDGPYGETVEDPNDHLELASKIDIMLDRRSMLLSSMARRKAESLTWDNCYKNTLLALKNIPVQ